MASPSTAPRQFPALPDQMGIWFDIEGRGAANAYNIGGAAWINGLLDPARFEIALATVIGWHESLRLAFDATPDGLLQHVASDVPFSLNRIDCSAEPDPEAAARRVMAQRFDLPFDLAHPGLFRFDLLELGPRRWCWLAVYQHLIADAWAIFMITCQVAAAYEALGRGEAPSRPAGGQWSEHAAEQQAYLESPRFAEDAAYWLDLHQPPSPPLFAPRRAGEEGSRVHRLFLRRQHYQQLGAFAKAQGATPSALFLAAIYALFARIEGQWDISFGTPTLNRRTARDKQTAGLFTTVSALRCQYAPALPFGDLMRAIATGQRRGYRYQRYPLAELNRRLALAAAGRRHVFDTSFSFEVNDFDLTIEDGPIGAEAMVNTAGLDPLALFVRDYPERDQIQIDFVYRRRYFDQAAIERMVDRFGSLLEALPDCADLALADLPVLPAAERRLVIAGFNGTARGLDRPAGLIEAFEAQAARTPERTAVICGEARATYAELNARSNRLAHCLAGMGVGPETPVGVCLERSVEMVASLLGVSKSGAAFLSLDPEYPAERLAFMLADSAVPVVITSGQTAGWIPRPGSCRLLDLEAEPLEFFPPENPPRHPEPASLAYVVYTSGSTGNPKGVAISHQAVASFLNAAVALGLVRPGDRLLAGASPSLDIAGLELFGPLLCGATVVVVEGSERRDAHALAARFASVQPTVMLSIPAGWRMLLEAGWQPTAGTRLLCCGEALTRDLAESLLVAGGSLTNLYGSAEATICVTAKEVKRPLEDTAISIGSPFPNTQAYILDERLSPVGIGVAGELWLGGALLARGYLGRPGLTAERFMADPFGPPGSRIYRTGDLARWCAAGELEFLGRLDQQIKIRGFRIEPGEVEAALRAFPGVHDAVVVARDDGAGMRLVAYLTGALDLAALRRGLASRLPDYLVPRTFVTLGALPLNPHGKLDRQALPAPPRELEPAPAIAPRTDTPGSGLCNASLALEINGALDVEALRRALVALEERQHALRLRPDASPEDPAGVRQSPDAPGALRLEVVEISGAAAAERLRTEAARPFQLDREAPVRALLLDLSDRRWQLLLVLHQSVCEDWSVPGLLGDLAALYARECCAGAPPINRRYEDCAAPQRDLAGSPEGRALVERWRRRLDPLPEPLPLATDHRRPPVRRGRGGAAELYLDAATTGRLRTLAGQSGATPFMVLLALTEVLLYRHCGATDLVLGTLATGRDRAELAPLVGSFVHTMVLRQTIDPEASFRTLLAGSRAVCLEALAEQGCPFEAVVEACGAPRDTSRNPLFDVLAVWRQEALQPPVFPGLITRLIELPYLYSKYDLAFYFGESGDGLTARLEYDADLFEASTITAMLGRFEHLTAAALANPDTAVCNLPVMPDQEFSKVLQGFNDTARNLATRRTIPQLFLEQVARTSDAPAVLAGGQILTYVGFARRAGAVAAALVASGVTPGEVVAVCARRSVDLLAAIHGVLVAGAAYAPLDPDHPPARRQEMLEDLGHPRVLAAEDCAALFPDERRVPIPSTTAEPALRSTDPDALAYVIFTSGSTGRPKGVAIEHHSVLNRILWMQETFPIGPGHVILQKTPVTFDVSVWELLWWSWTGAAVAVAPPGAEKDPRALADAVERYGVTVLHFVPSMLAAFLTAIEDGRIASSRLASLRYVFASGEALEAGLVERFNRLLHASYGIELHNLYGPTESTVDVTWQPCSPSNGDEVVPIGRPIANTRIRILSADGRPVPIGVPGEIYVGGPQVARGYVNRPELNAARFVPDPFDATVRLYRTGDRGRWRVDGAIEYLGRLDQQVKIRGFRVECGEIEQALEAHASVERAVVVAAEAWGLTELHAYLLGAGLDGPGLRAHLRGRLPEYMVPARFFRMETLPLTPSGKVNRKALTGHPLEANEAAPESPIETELLAIWRQLLPEARFGLHDGFFDAGGHSLLLLRLQEQFERRWPGVFTVADLFSYANIADQARRIEAEQAAPPNDVGAIFGMPGRPADLRRPRPALAGFRLPSTGGDSPALQSLSKESH